MSAATAKARPAARPELRRDEVHELRLVQGTRPRRSLMAVVALLVVVALASVVTSMVLNTRMAQMLRAKMKNPKTQRERVMTVSIGTRLRVTSRGFQPRQCRSQA